MAPDSIARFRRFARAVTAEVGALDSSFLGRGRPLGAARVVNAIGAGRTDVAEIRAYLDLDSGLMSRLLRSLEEEGLVATEPHPDDARRRVAHLTEAGQREFVAYEGLSDARASAVLTRAPRVEDLLRAMDLVALMLGRDRIAITEVDPRGEAARTCLEAYYAELASRLRTGFDVTLSRDPEAAAMVRPRGAFLLAMADGLPVGCVALKGSGGPVAEVKRLWIDPVARGLGVAGRLMQAVEDRARALSVTALRLDTNSALPEALALYRKTGWVEIERFNDDPYPDRFFEKVL
ncbi:MULTISPECIES: helix-turn-helix domain-containing GNAT family N-acetyltransferase [unclassified Methylobacterium]|uniref:bifunctional helix-turn-helix transcriptional regulator/GNAT family N-acetyltransferase n=1 Tax=unclassified Methylobacterium TaxID=2615210 RepID=UPI0011C20C35|nr:MULTISPECIES: helix-turn-helix domain-containing GNAT family N-acetyltransferase [unclassified Methylobacterium]QEE39450.1 MarR family transcriptional regulator [Methylobacterium sp. WL1]TXN57023.1 MarR family transcriptional regulator [Methylobacterium sp. WL2]